MVRRAMKKNKGNRKCGLDNALVTVDREVLVIQVTFEQRPEGGKRTNSRQQRKNIAGGDRGRGVLSMFEE